MRTEQECRYDFSGERLLLTHLRECNTSGCPGCEPCPARHCQLPGCPGRHLADHEPWVCAKCVGHIRGTLSQILTLSGRLLTEAVHQGIESEAAMLAGPAADPQLYGYRKRCSLDSDRTMLDFHHTNRDEPHPLWVVESWDRMVVERLDQTRGQRTTLAGYVAYLGGQLTDLARDPEFPMDEMARELRQTRAHLEDVLRDGIRHQRGAPCTVCGQANLLKQYDELVVRGRDGKPVLDSHGNEKPVLDDDGFEVPDDWWWCPMCGGEWADSDYQARVAGLFPSFADRLTASQIEETYRVQAGTVRVWASREKVRKRGRDRQGRMLYDVGDVLACRDSDLLTA